MENHFPGNLFALMHRTSANVNIQMLGSKLGLSNAKIYYHLNHPDEAPAEELRNYCQLFCDFGIEDMSLQKLLYEDLSGLMGQTGQTHYGMMHPTPTYDRKNDPDPRPNHSS